MVVAEVPLWVLHGNADSMNSGSRIPGMLSTFNKSSKSKKPADDDDGKDGNASHDNGSNKAAVVGANAALSLLQSTRGGSNRAPMYSIDFHPDGSRFATAAGDGTVRIWSSEGLFGGRVVLDEGREEERRRRRRVRPSSKFTEAGNYVSSNSEDYDSSSSSSLSKHGDSPESPSPEGKRQTGSPSGEVNDLSGLVRKKKGSRAASPSVPAKPEPRPAAKRLLSTISSHEGSVLSLRFSPSGRYLASAGDDSYVNIYCRSNSASIANKGNLVGVDSFGNSSLAAVDIEHWNRIAICRGHHLDVVGIAWAPDDSHLVSCSLDSVHPVIVWKLYDVLGNEDPAATGVSAMCNLHPFKILGRNVHTSTVKGVAFDPAGKYIATSGDDPAICIWRAFDDWGLEARVDSSSGVFRSKKRVRKSATSPAANDTNAAEGPPSPEEEEDDDPGELASLSLFRRISFAPDGSHVCGTNATLRGKNIAAMISREGWAASAPSGAVENGTAATAHRQNPPGAANLVGHKQPVVSSRHCPVFFEVPRKRHKRAQKPQSSSEDDSVESDDPDVEPDYATLVALGDKRGFVTVWSTKSSRPLFKLQCSESRCTVTDICWGLVRTQSDNNDTKSLVMIVSLLDGYVVALQFSIPDEVGGGNVLSEEKHRRIFRLKYGFEDIWGGYGASPLRRKRLVDDSGPTLIENALQMTMEMKNANDGNESSSSHSFEGKKTSPPRNDNIATSPLNIREKQVETVSTASGKKRIRPVLMNAVGDAAPSNNVSDEDAPVNGGNETTDSKRKQKKHRVRGPDSLENVLDVAAQAASVAESVGSKAMRRERMVGQEEQTPRHLETEKHSGIHAPIGGSMSPMGMHTVLPVHTNKFHSVDLVTKSDLPSFSMPAFGENNHRVVADCNNSTTVSGANSWPTATLTISRGGVRQWKDIITKSWCTAIAANTRLLVIGTSDGCLYFYGTSPSLGWESGKAFRAFPPFVLGNPVVEVSFGTCHDDASDTIASDIIVVTSNGNFFVYQLLPTGPKLHYKGTVVPPMQQMRLSSTPENKRNLSILPKLARIQITESRHLILILLLSTSCSKSLQGFVYHRDMELWMRISDSNNFLLSDYYSSLPGSSTKNGTIPSDDSNGLLSRMEKIVRSSGTNLASAKQMYLKVTENEKVSSQKIVTRAHCEDRLACAIAVGSASEFKFWLSLYARCLTSSGEADCLRFLVDVLLGNTSLSIGDRSMSCWWLISVGGLGLDNRSIIRQLILPEMSKNRSLQRLTNEVAMELESL